MSAEPNILLAAALTYAERFGFAFFPCKPRGKTPLTEHGFKDASKDPAQISEWWTRWPDANIGIVTGEISGVIVIDIDPRHGGDESLAALEAKHGPLPTAPTALTGGGGLHIYFRAPASVKIANSAGRLGPGIDVRGDGGYVIAPPSVHASGQPYRWKADARIDQIELPAMPPWLLELLTTASTGSEKTARFEAAGEFPEGERNDRLYRTARSLRARHHFSFDEMLPTLRAVNQARCKPLLPDAEIDQIARNAIAQPDAPGFNADSPEMREAAALLKLDPIARATAKKALAAKLKVPIKAIDEALKAIRKRLEHSNGNAPSSTGTGVSGCSDGRSDAPLDIDQLRRAGAPVLEAYDPLEPVRSALARRGYAGDTRPPELVYVAIASRFQPRPINLHIEGPSAAGKNYAVDSGAVFHPPEAFYKLSASSPRALVYTDEQFKNRTVIIGEMDSIPRDGPAASAIRSIANDARMDYETVEKDPETGQFVTRKISKEGPTGFITTGTRPLDHQMATRCLTVPMADDPAQTAAIMCAEASEAEGALRADVDLEPFHAAQRWLAHAGESRVIVPFARELAALVPAAAVRARRDFKQLLATVKTFAFLSQIDRKRSHDGMVVATIDDYARARRLLAPLFDSILGDDITPAIRETVEVIEDGKEISEAELAARLEFAKSTIHYRVSKAIRGGWIQNLESRRGYPARLSRGAPLPEDRSALPAVESVYKAFDSRQHDPNTREATRREGLDKCAFECSDGNEDDALILDPDADLSDERDA
jgi:hypothetical protein